MPSLMELLLDTMPMAAAKNALQLREDKSFDELEAAEVRAVLRFLGPEESLGVPVPAVSKARTKRTQPLWGWTHDANHPATVRDVYCRVRDADYVAHRVVDHLSWGQEEPIGTLKQSITVTFAAGGQVSLPLSKDYVFWKVLVKGGKIADDQTRLWRLESVVDSGLVVAFVYDIDPVSGQVMPVDLDAIKDPKAKEDWEQTRRAVKELMGSSADGARGSGPGTDGAGGASGSGGEPDEIAPFDAPPPTVLVPEEETDFIGPPLGPDQPPTDPVPWAQRIQSGDIFWRPGWEPKAGATGASAPVVHGEVGEVHDVATGPAVVVVLVSFTFCCERADFEPSGIVGFARCYPHLMVKANVALACVEASLQLDRPAKLTTLHEPDRDMAKTCCKPGYDGWTEEIRSLLVTDANINDTPFIEPLKGPPLPFWSNMFSYFLEDPYVTHRTTKFHIVRTDIDYEREIDGLVVRDLAPSGSYTETQKAPFQGAFDNLHIAPRLKLLRVAKVMGPLDAIAYLKEGEDPLTKSFISVVPVGDTAPLHLDRIAMAPFCAHDCLHVHWRWATHASAKWVLGWNESDPYEEAGAPMVPRGQDVWLWFRSESTTTYHVKAKIHGERAYDWCVLMHHGFGYAVSTENVDMFQRAMSAVSLMAGQYVFMDADNNTITAVNSTAAYYWNARYELAKKDGKFVAVARIYGKTPDAMDRAASF